MFGTLVCAAVLERKPGVAAEGDKVGEQKSVGGMDFVDRQFHLAGRATDGMADEGERHTLAAPIVAAAAPFFAAGALPLRRETVVEEETGIAFERCEISVARERVRRPNDVTGPVAAAFDLSGIEQLQVFAELRMRKVAVGCVEVANAVRRIVVWLVANFPANVVHWFADSFR